MGLLGVQVLGGVDLELASERCSQISFIYCVFTFFFVMFHGVVSTMGLILELYPPESVGQYSWPFRRKVLFIPIASVITSATVVALVRALRSRISLMADTKPVVVINRLIDCMTVLTAVGTVSIWPSKIGVLYVVYLCVALWSFNRLNAGLAVIDGQYSVVELE